MNGIGDSEAALKALEISGRETAGAIDEAFAQAGQSLAQSLARAAADGKVSLKELASALVAAVNAAAGANGGLSDAFAQMFTSAFSGGFSGARADGGFVGAGGAYLVGERGPEVFRPAVSGNIEGSAAPSVNVTVVVPGGAQGLVRSEAQVAAALQRAARMGVR